jgi:hypothetical protein
LERRKLSLDAAAPAVLCLAALLDTIDVTVVNVAVPAIKNAPHFREAVTRAAGDQHRPATAAGQANCREIPAKPARRPEPDVLLFSSRRKT